MKNLKKITLLAMLSLYATAFAGDENIFENNSSSSYEGNSTFAKGLGGDGLDDGDDTGGPSKGLDGTGLDDSDDTVPIDGYVLALAGAALGIIVLYRKKIVLSDNKL